MATNTRQQERNVGTRNERPAGPPSEDHGRQTGPNLTSEKVRKAIAKTSFAILGYVTPSGEPRSSGVVYETLDGRMYIAVAPDSWKARHVAAMGRVAVTVPVRRAGSSPCCSPSRRQRSASTDGRSCTGPGRRKWVRS
jgi:hypothetical protein